MTEPKEGTCAKGCDLPAGHANCCCYYGPGTFGNPNVAMDSSLRRVE